MRRNVVTALLITLASGFAISCAAVGFSTFRRMFPAPVKMLVATASPVLLVFNN